MICPLLEGGYGPVKIYRGLIFTTEGVYELPAESIYWSGGTREDRGRCCPLMYQRSGVDQLRCAGNAGGRDIPSSWSWPTAFPRLLLLLW
jgi:hypothetical protein